MGKKSTNTLQMADWLFQNFNRYRNKEIVAITDGGVGSVITDGKKSLSISPCNIGKVKDSTGAGDAYFGGLITGIFYSLPLKEIGLLANACGAVCCTQVGAFPIRGKSRSEVLKLYRGRSFRPVPVGSKKKKADPLVESAVGVYFQTALKELVSLTENQSGETILQAMNLILKQEKKGCRVHVTGIGKPEHVAKYAASLLSSTGTPTTFLHGTECTHGSAGQVKKGDVVIAISNSGSSLVDTARTVKRMGAHLIVVSGNPSSLLAAEGEVFLYAGTGEEGGPLGLAPRASILAEIHILAALSVALQSSKKFTRKDYNRRHPAGSLGKISGGS